MTRLIGGIGLVVPPALAALYVMMPERVAAWAGSPDVLSLAAAVAGGTFVVSLTVLVVLAWVRFRLRRLVAAVERLAEGETDLDLPAGHGFDRRMIEAINGVSRALSTTQHAATVDKLTGIPNRQALLAELFTEVERATRYQRPLSVAFVDIDHFKPINDTYGHEVGDIVLRAVAQTLRGNIRSTDMVGRYGGEEFMLLLRESSVEDGVVLAEKLRLLVQRLSFNVAGNPNLNVTISIGLAGGEGQQIRVDTLIRDADAAMYSAKALGRNQTYIFEEPDEDARVPRAPISASGRARAIQVGKTARDAAAAALTSVLAPLPHYRGQPSALIASIVEGLARQLELPEVEIERLRIAALLHDLGKVAVPQEILDKPAALTSAEWRTVVQHPRVGQIILEQASMLKEAVPIILHHHERYSGDGYPYGLRGTDIPLGARIVAVADAYDAMTHDRPYKRAISHEEAIRELRRHAGTQFDPELVALFCDLYAHEAPQPDAAVLAMTAVDDAHATWSGPVIVPGEKPRRRSRMSAIG